MNAQPEDPLKENGTRMPPTADPDYTRKLKRGELIAARIGIALAGFFLVWLLWYGMPHDTPHENILAIVFAVIYVPLMAGAMWLVWKVIESLLVFLHRIIARQEAARRERHEARHKDKPREDWDNHGDAP